MMLPDDELAQFFPLVERIAARLAGGAPSGLEREDLVAAGMCGLLEARVRWDGSTPFAAFARPRIEGAVHDEIRAFDWRGRRGRERAAERARAASDLRQEVGREVTTDEIADATGQDPDDIAAEAALAQPVIALSALAIELAGDETVDEAVLMTERDRLARAVERLTEREQLALALVYSEGLDQREAAAVMGVSVRRVGHLHTAALMKLRHLLRPDDV